MTTATIPDGRIGLLANNAKCANCMVPIPRGTKAWIAYKGGSITCLSCVGGDAASQSASEPAAGNAPDASLPPSAPPAAPTATVSAVTATPHAETPEPVNTQTDIAPASARTVTVDPDVVSTLEAAAEQARAERDEATRQLERRTAAADRQIAEITSQMSSNRDTHEQAVAALTQQISALTEQLAAAGNSDTTADLTEQLVATQARHQALLDERSSLANQLADATAERDRYASDLAEIHAAQADAADQAASTKNLDRTVVIGTGIVLASVAVLTYVGGVFSAMHYAGWSPVMAALVPLCIEAGAAVELASLVRDRRSGRHSHWSAKLLATGLLGMSITAMILHATDAPTGSHRWWAYVIACGLPLELAALVRAALGGDHPTATKTHKARQT